MNFITSHIEQEKVKIELSELRNVGEIEYRTLDLGIFTSVTLSPEQIEETFEEIDFKIHLPSETHQYMKERIEELENKVADLEDALEEAQECDNHNNFDGECDFYEAK